MVAAPALASDPTSVLDCDLCIVGAGYAALNGLNAAAKYLKKGERVVFVDKNATWGGQWVQQYDFVRLHQPYQMFTAGDQPWTLKRDPSHLATRREILAHLASVPAVSAGPSRDQAALRTRISCSPRLGGARRHRGGPPVDRP